MANNNKSTSTKIFLFFATKDLHPRISFDIVDLSNTNTHEQILKQKTFDISGNIETAWKFAWKAIIVAYESQSK